MTSLVQSVVKFKSWLFEESLPLWADRGLDYEWGGFHERLAPDGRVEHHPRRARVTGRQIYAFATAERLGWGGPTRQIVRHGLAFLDRHLCDDGTRLIPTISRKGEPLPGEFDLYDQAFGLFGLAAAASIDEDPLCQHVLAQRLLGQMRKSWKHPAAGFEEAVPRILPLKANPHMHLLEAALAWSEIDPDGGWSEMADEIAELCLSRFLHPSNGAVREYFDGDWRFLESRETNVVEPGHQFEWAWLLIRWGRSRQRDDAIVAARRLIGLAEARGVSSSHQMAMNELEPDLAPRDDRMRLWPQTERIKAHVALRGLARNGAERAAADEAIRIAIEGLLPFFDHPCPGSWWEHHDAAGRPLVESARASSLYHIICAADVIASTPLWREASVTPTAKPSATTW